MGCDYYIMTDLRITYLKSDNTTDSICVEFDQVNGYIDEFDDGEECDIEYNSDDEALYTWNIDKVKLPDDHLIYENKTWLTDDSTDLYGTKKVLEDLKISLDQVTTIEFEYWAKDRT